MKTEDVLLVAWDCPRDPDHPSELDMSKATLIITRPSFEEHTFNVLQVVTGFPAVVIYSRLFSMPETGLKINYDGSLVSPNEEDEGPII